MSLQGVKVKFTEQNVFCKHFGTIFGVGWMGKGQNVENQNVESLKVDWKFEKDQNVKRTDKLDFRRSDHPKILSIFWPFDVLIFDVLTPSRMNNIPT